MTKGKVGRPSIPEEEKRKNRVFKATDEEWQLIKEHAQEAGLSVSKYIRIRAMRQQITKEPNQKRKEGQGDNSNSIN